MTNEELLAEIEDILRNAPSQKTILSESSENYSWLGRVAAALEVWNDVVGGLAILDINHIQNTIPAISNKALSNTFILLHKARYDLLMKTTGPINLVVSAGMVFNYFDEIRKIIETSNQEVFFVDPYLDAVYIMGI